jgi:hypothetical protein
MKWFLIYTTTILPPPCGGIDCGINPSYRSTYQEQRLEMPSLEVCRQVRSTNAGAKCITEDVDADAAPKGDKLFNERWPYGTTENRNLPGIVVIPDGKPN